MPNLSTQDVSSVNNTIQSNPNSISSLSTSNSSQFVSGIMNNGTSAVGDPINAILSKTLNKIATVSVSANKKIDDFITQLTNYQSKNGQVSVVGNQIIITVTSKDAAKGQAEEQIIQNQINSIRNILNTLNSTINALSAISQTISVIMSILDVQEALIGINPIAKVAFTVFKTAIKVVFLKDMLGTYSNLIQNQITESSQELNLLTQKFMGLQVSLNIKDNTGQGIATTPSEALSNITQDLLGGSPNTSNQSNIFTANNSHVYILKVEKIGTSQLIGKAIDQQTGELAAQTSPSYISTSDELIQELKTIINA